MRRQSAGIAVSRAAVWTGVTASQALFSLTVRHTPARTRRVDADGAQARREGGARRRAEAAERASGSRERGCLHGVHASRRAAWTLADGEGRADTSGVWTAEADGRELSAGTAGRRDPSRLASGVVALKFKPKRVLSSQCLRVQGSVETADNTERGDGDGGWLVDGAVQLQRAQVASMWQCVLAGG